MIGKDACELHEALGVVLGKRQDPCVIDVFLSVISFMEGGKPLSWWSFTDERKKYLVQQADTKKTFLMPIEQTIPLLEKILDKWHPVINKDFEGYKNHVYRMLNFCFYLHEPSDEERQKLIIAACFHDLGLWSNKTVDYLPPSIVLAKDYLQQNDLEQWSAEIELIIDMHHKVTEYKNTAYPLVEVLRKADLADFSLGLIKGGIATDYIKEVKVAFPNAGFHKMLCKEQGKWLSKHPLNPFPIIKW